MSERDIERLFLFFSDSIFFGPLLHGLPQFGILRLVHVQPFSNKRRESWYT